ncbi:hypothetical protein B0H11DRAFT_2198727 [Mycena galericulata]|nr:hypothetical protein B0H11DRAFT_2198727 [Mycena galericulata]
MAVSTSRKVAVKAATTLYFLFLAFLILIPYTLTPHVLETYPLARAFAVTFIWIAKKLLQGTGVLSLIGAIAALCNLFHDAYGRLIGRATVASTPADLENGSAPRLDDLAALEVEAVAADPAPVAPTPEPKRSAVRRIVAVAFGSLYFVFVFYLYSIMSQDEPIPENIGTAGLFILGGLEVDFVFLLLCGGVGCCARRGRRAAVTAPVLPTAVSATAAEVVFDEAAPATKEERDHKDVPSIEVDLQSETESYGKPDELSDTISVNWEETTHTPRTHWQLGPNVPELVRPSFAEQAPDSSTQALIALASLSSLHPPTHPIMAQTSHSRKAAAEVRVAVSVGFTLGALVRYLQKPGVVETYKPQARAFTMAFVWIVETYPHARYFAVAFIWIAENLTQGAAVFFLIAALATLLHDAYGRLTGRAQAASTTSTPADLENGSAPRLDDLAALEAEVATAEPPASPTPKSKSSAVHRIVYSALGIVYFFSVFLMFSVVSLEKPFRENVGATSLFIVRGLVVDIVFFLLCGIRGCWGRRAAVTAPVLPTAVSATAAEVVLDQAAPATKEEKEYKDVVAEEEKASS